MVHLGPHTTAINNSFVAKPGTPYSFLKANHITRTRHAHQVTAVALSVFSKRSF